MLKHKITMQRFMVCAFWAGLLVFSSCKKDDFYTGSDAKLQFSNNQITFDTVFTSVSTITKVLKVKNPYKTDIKTDIVLVGGATSYFSINVDGVPMQQQHLKDVEIPALDSIFIFIKANINPNGVNNPLLACDTLRFTTNGNKQNVELLAYGQDAHFILPNAILYQTDGKDTIKTPYRIIAEEGQEIRWKNDKPYVIHGVAIVDTDAKLIIEKGTRIYLHKDAGLWVYIDGCLEVNGTKDEPVTFQSDRLEDWYQKGYELWDRILICEGKKDNKINYAIIKNAVIGVQTETIDLTSGSSNKLVLTNTIIKHSKIGLLSKNYTIEASNNVFMDCMQQCVALTLGGDYTFVNNTIYNRYNNRRTDAALYISNGYADLKIHKDFSGIFINNIVSGVRDEEFKPSYDVKEANFLATFENCLLRTSEEYLKRVAHTNTLWNYNPDFENAEDYKNLKPKSTSPCKNAGKAVPWLQTDIEGNPRNSSAPSIGAYE
jgi:hypothetical protein